LLFLEWKTRNDLLLCKSRGYFYKKGKIREQVYRITITMPKKLKMLFGAKEK